ncbi:MAG: hypothetical protein A3B68_06845 [Candidatus Melainabacteria bacterium RIFCSPHIGHO2_02_FULL_34_12]|nr:MAG: hypothetical protein A3B68_06845 [Candidatus Melainabacteria bacterium RIFCSPHIGHO2_02_FULL_34_12]
MSVQNATIRGATCRALALMAVGGAAAFGGFLPAAIYVGMGALKNGAQASAREHSTPENSTKHENVNPLGNA